jgi:hypothetical protein
MRRALAAVAVASALFAVPAHAEYTRDCGGIVDDHCSGVTCPMDCFRNDCLLWLDPLHNPVSAQCLG